MAQARLKQINDQFKPKLMDINVQNRVAVLAFDPPSKVISIDRPFIREVIALLH